MIEQVQTALIALIFFMAVYVVIRQHKIRRSVRDVAQRIDRLGRSIRTIEKSVPKTAKSVDALSRSMPRMTESLGSLEKPISKLPGPLSAIQKDLAGLAKSSSEFHTKKAAALAWKQTEALMAVYRLIDGAPTVPPTGGWAVSADLLNILLTHIANHQPKTILECGSGTSTIAMAYASQRYGGRVFAIENDSDYAARLEDDIKARGLADTATIIRGELTERSYPGFDHRFKWYGVPPEMLPSSADMLVVDGPRGNLNRYARYPAGPELLKLLSPDAHVFLDDTNRPEEQALPELWRDLYPRLSSQVLSVEKGAIQLFFDK